MSFISQKSLSYKIEILATEIDKLEYQLEILKLSHGNDSTFKIEDTNLYTKLEGKKLCLSYLERIQENEISAFTVNTDDLLKIILLGL